MNDETNVDTAESSVAQAPPNVTDSDRAYAEAVRRATESGAAPPAPWEIVQNTWEPPRVPDGTPRFAAYQDAPTSAAPPPAVPPIAPGAMYRPPVAGPTGFAVADHEGDQSKIKLIAGAIVAILIVAFLLFELVPGSNAAPGTFKRYVSSDGRFSCDVPSQWTLTSSAADPTDKTAVGGMLAKAGAAKIDVTSDTVASLRASILLNSSAALPEGMFNDPVNQLHNADKAKIAAAMKDYNELAPQTMESGMGDALVSEFTGKGGFLGLGGAMHGYRASMVDGDYTFEIVLQCPEKSWSDLKPAFERVIKGMAPGEGGVFSPNDSSKPTDFGSAGTPVPSDQGSASTLTQPNSSAQPAANPNLPTVGYGGAPPPDTTPDSGTDTAPAGDDGQ